MVHKHCAVPPAVSQVPGKGQYDCKKKNVYTTIEKDENKTFTDYRLLWHDMRTLH